jgi:hypothetical protein
MFKMTRFKGKSDIFEMESEKKIGHISKKLNRIKINFPSSKLL